MFENFVFIVDKDIIKDEQHLYSWATDKWKSKFMSLL